MARSRKPSPKRLPEFDPRHPLAALDGVEPIRGERRVPFTPKTSSRIVDQQAHAEGPCFVIERDEDHVQAYRSELGERALHRVLGGRFVPQESIDLHGCRASGLREELARVVRDAVRRGVTRLLIIHGKGLHSDAGMGVLGAAVLEALTEGPAARWVSVLATAPRKLGGSGATVVELAKP